MSLNSFLVPPKLPMMHLTYNSDYASILIMALIALRDILGELISLSVFAGNKALSAVNLGFSLCTLKGIPH